MKNYFILLDCSRKSRYGIMASHVCAKAWTMLIAAAWKDTLTRQEQVIRVRGMHGQAERGCHHPPRSDRTAFP